MHLARGPAGVGGRGELGLAIGRFAVIERPLEDQKFFPIGVFVLSEGLKALFDISDKGSLPGLRFVIERIRDGLVPNLAFPAGHGLEAIFKVEIFKFDVLHRLRCSQWYLSGVPNGLNSILRQS